LFTLVELVKEGQKKERRETKLNESAMNDARERINETDGSIELVYLGF
jgi:hypothetical protein